MDNLIHNMFDLSKVELGALEIHREPVALKPFLERVYEIGMALPWRSNVAFEVDLPDDLPEATIDPARIQQVLMNLITNALKYTHQGTVTLHAHQPASDLVEIGVRDTGEGIPEEAHAMIFERFRQFDDHHNRRMKGAGLGLAICRDLIDQHGGQIMVSSTVGQGSNFVFRLSV